MEAVCALGSMPLREEVSNLRKKSVWSLFWLVMLGVGWFFAGASAVGDPLIDSFYCEIQRYEVTPPGGDLVFERDNYWYVVNGGGSGYTFADPDYQGQWLYYDNPGTEVPWWVNQWYYDHPFDPNRKKEFKVMFMLKIFDVEDFELKVALNWTNEEWPGRPDGPPPFPYEEQFISRETIPLVLLTDDDGLPFERQIVTFEYTLWDYNPEWVSIDVWGYNVSLTDGIFEHECLPVPEPASLVLMGLGLGGIILRRRIKKR